MFGNIIDNDTYMKCDIYDYDNKYHIEIDLPGFKRENINLEFNRGYLTVIASKKNNTDIDEKNYIKRERTYGIYKQGSRSGGNKAKRTCSSYFRPAGYASFKMCPDSHSDC